MGYLASGAKPDGAAAPSADGATLFSPTTGKKVAPAGAVPAELRCEINGHLMRDPVRTPAGRVFERETIELWLRTRGSVCPISGAPLTADDLAPEAELRRAIMRYHIQQHAAAGGAADADDGDVYDF